MWMSVVGWLGVLGCAALAVLAMKGRRWFEAGSTGALGAVLAISVSGLSDRLGMVMLFLVALSLALFIGHVVQARRSRRPHPEAM